MKKIITLLLATVLLSNLSLAQDLNKKIYLSKESHEAGLIDLVTPVINKRIIIATSKKKNLQLQLLDFEFNEIKSKQLILHDEVAQYKIMGDRMLIYYYEFKSTTIHQIDLSDNELNVETIDLEKGEKRERFLGSGVDFRKNNEKSTKKNSLYDVVIYDTDGKDIYTSELLVDDKFIHNPVCGKQIRDYFIGNYSVGQKPNNQKVGNSGEKKVNYTGVAVASEKEGKSFKEFYKWTDFSNLNQLFIKYKDAQDLIKLNFSLDNLIATDNGFVVAGTIYKNIWKYIDGGSYYDGRLLQYAVVWIFDHNGKLLWDQAIHIDNKYKQRNKNSAEFLNLEHPISLKVENDKVIIHYAYEQGILYSEIEKGKITKQEDTEYKFLEEAKGLKDIISQYQLSSYWYDDYYFSFIRSYNPKLDGGKESNYLYLNRIKFKK